MANVNIFMVKPQDSAIVCLPQWMLLLIQARTLETCSTRDGGGLFSEVCSVVVRVMVN